MADININEISQNYTYNIGNSSYASVALPITSCWGPGYEPDTDIESTDLDDDALESIVWKRFPATQQGLQAFNSTYRGPVSNYRLLNDNSFNEAMTLLTSGYELLVTRIAGGSQSQGVIYFTNKLDDGNYADVNLSEVDKSDSVLKLIVKGKYRGTFGNNLRVVIKYIPNYHRWNLLVYVVSETGTQEAVENKSFVFDVEHSTDTLPHIEELESDFIEISYCNILSDDVALGTIIESTDDKGKDTSTIEFGGLNADTYLKGGTDWVASMDTTKENIEKAVKLAAARYDFVEPGTIDAFRDTSKIESYESDGSYVGEIASLAKYDDKQMSHKIYFKQWVYTSAFMVLDTLQDKLTYNPQRIIMPGWDDQNFLEIKEDWESNSIPNGFWKTISPLHAKMMEVAYFSRCATAYLDVPKALKRKYVYNDSENDSELGYAQRLSRFTPAGFNLNINIGYFSSHSALFAPWGRYVYASTAKQAEAAPSFLALMIERAMILNQPTQYEWLLPTNRRHNLKIGKLDYNISKKYLDMWQKTEGVGVNCITNIPDMGVSIWGNSTLYEVPPATYQALANLSTRKLVNAIEDLAYRCGIGITFQYNNDQAYNSFYAGMTPLLDTMRNQGAIDDYYIRMAEDIDGLDSVNANSVVGKIYLTVNGVVNDINVDLIALPPTVDLNQYRI